MVNGVYSGSTRASMHLAALYYGVYHFPQLSRRSLKRLCVHRRSNVPLRLSCEAGQTIEVQSAVYGRTDKHGGRLSEVDAGDCGRDRDDLSSVLWM